MRQTEKSRDKTACGCPETNYLDSVLRKRGNPVCMKKPCLGTDCLIKAFEDAQDFVENLGKVPGLAGLGLSESPYFANKDELIRPSRKGECAKYPESDVKVPQKMPNVQQANPVVSTRETPRLDVPPKNCKAGGLVVQEGRPTLPDPKAAPNLKFKKIEEIENVQEPENNESSPCGNPKCKSKPKPNVTERNAEPNVTDIDVTKSKKKSSNRSDRKNMNQFIYTFGKYHPQRVYGHKDCQFIRPLVPSGMGWMWNKTDPVGKIKPRPGWKPGAISVFMRDLLKEAKDGFFNKKKQSRSAFSLLRKGGKDNKVKKIMSGFPVKLKTDEDDVDLPPNLHVHRKNGDYYVTMYPIRQDKDISRADEPINPLQFKIVKNRGSIASSSTASDMEIEFSPPAAVNRIKKKPDVVHVDTQVKQEEILKETKKTKDSTSKDVKGGKKKLSESKENKNEKKKTK